MAGCVTGIILKDYTDRTDMCDQEGDMCFSFSYEAPCILKMRNSEKHEALFECEDEGQLALCKARLIEFIASGIDFINPPRKMRGQFIGMGWMDIEERCFPHSRGKYYHISVNPGEVEIAVEKMKSMLKDDDSICGIMVCLDVGDDTLLDALTIKEGIEAMNKQWDDGYILIQILINEDNTVGHLDVWTIIRENNDNK